MATHTPSPAWLDRPIIGDPRKFFTLQNLLIALVIAFAILSRFAMLGERVMSHDEVNHVVPSYDLYQGKGYRHDPVTHGPFQFHVVALSYFMFGDNDFTSRIPAATFSVAAIVFLIFAFRRYLGRTGALIAGFLFLISPYMLFYGRYTRNEAFIELIGVVLLYGMLRYLETGDRLSMFLVTLATVMHFIVKETAFIYTAQALIFLFFMFIMEVRRAELKNPGRFNRFLYAMIGAMLLVLVALGLAIYKADVAGETSPTETQAAESAAESPSPTPTPTSLTDPAHLRLYGEIIAIAGALALATFGLLTIISDIGWGQLKRMRSFSLLVIIFTLILPMLAPLPVTMLGMNPIDYNNTTVMWVTGGFVLLFFVIGAAIGILWNPILWLQNALLFYAIFTVFYTTFFTNTFGFWTGLVGSLGYWASQQEVERGTQPRYYYALLQMPIYEYLAYFGAILAANLGAIYWKFWHFPGFAPAFSPRVEKAEPAAAEESAPEEVPVTGLAAVEDPAPLPEEIDPELEEDAKTVQFYAEPQPLPVLAMFLFWGITSLIAFSFAGERMPWLTVHVTMGFLLASAWGLGFLVDTTDWRRIANSNGILAVLLIPVFIISFNRAASALLGTVRPFSGSTLEQLEVTNTFVIASIAALGSLAGIIYLLRNWRFPQIFRLATVAFFALLMVLTARTAYRASFINYDYANEYLVYAHAAPGPKQVLRQIEEISQRTVGGKNIQVAYSSDMLYPYWWYLRDYPNHRWFQSNPTRDLRDFAVIVAGEDVYGKIDPIVQDNFIQYDYIRLWWPNQDYYNLTLDRVWGAISNPEMRKAVFDIWLNRDFSEYARLTNQTGPLSLETWSPAARMRVYIRKDIVGQIWDYGASPVVLDPAQSDPYAEQLIELAPEQVVGGAGAEPGQFNAPRGLRVAPDGTLYVADSRNHRIQHLAADGTVLHTWGVFGDSNTGAIPDGSFNEPWDVAIGPDGSVYVTDTWNHRVQKFTADGQFLAKWGSFGQGETATAFWGPRGIAVDPLGRVYVMDTGNKRVVIFDPDGNFLAQFGTAGFGEGQFDEPVGVSLDADGNVYVTDTWNQRVQVFAPGGEGGLQFAPLRAWDIAGWDGQSLENKPYLAVSPVTGNVFVADPEGPRVLEFDPEGNFVRGWGDYSTEPDGFNIVSGLAFDQNGDLWVSDGGNNRLLRFRLP